ERRIAVSRLDPATGKSDIWVIELARPAMCRVTATPADEDMTRFSSDGDYLVFRSLRGATCAIHRKMASGDGAVEVVAEGLTAPVAVPLDWSRDRPALLYATGGDTGAVTSLWSLALDSGRATRVYEGERTTLPNTRISPNGRWAAYVSDQSGRNEVYVRPFPVGDGK